MLLLSLLNAHRMGLLCFHTSRWCGGSASELSCLRALATLVHVSSAQLVSQLRLVPSAHDIAHCLSLPKRHQSSGRWTSRSQTPKKTPSSTDDGGPALPRGPRIQRAVLLLADTRTVDGSSRHEQTILYSSTYLSRTRVYILYQCTPVVSTALTFELVISAVDIHIYRLNGIFNNTYSHINYCFMFECFSGGG